MAAITPVDFADLDADLSAALRRRYERLGYLGDFFRCMAHQPAALRHFDAFTEELKHALGAQLAELVAITVATRLGNDYELHQHERLAVARGLDPDWVAAVERLEPASLVDRFDEGDRTVQQFVLDAIDGFGRDTSSTADSFERVVEGCGDEIAAGVALLTARFVGHALVSSACRLQPPVTSIFEPGGEL